MTESPFKPNDPTDEPITKKLILLGGHPKSGKSTLAAGFPDGLFIDTERSYRNIQLPRVATVTHWPEIKNACLMAAAAKNPGPRIVDSVTRMYDKCRMFVLNREGWKDEREGGGFGAGFAVVRNEFRSALGPLLDGCDEGRFGLLLVTHLVTHTLEKPTGDITLLKANIPDQKTYDLLESAADCLLIYTVQQTAAGRKHIMYAQPDGFHVAGDRTGRFPPQFEMPEVNGTPTERARAVFAALDAVYRGSNNNDKGSK